MELMSIINEVWDLTEASKKKTQRQKKIAKVMREFKEGKLKSGSGDTVTDRDQAMAIALSMADEESGD